MSADLVEFLTARLDEQEQKTVPKTVIHSGGHPAPVIPNCIGPSGTGCFEGWRIDAPDPGAELAHELTHATPEQRFALADIAAKRRILARAAGQSYTGPAAGAIGPDGRRISVVIKHVTEPEMPWLLRLLAEPFADHPDFNPAWRTA